MLATRVGGTPTTHHGQHLDDVVLFDIDQAQRRIHQQLHLVQQMELVVVQRSQIVAQRIEARLDRGREFRTAHRRDIGHDTRQRQEAVPDLRGQIAAGPEPAQDRAQIRVFLGARAAVAAADRARPEQPVRHRVQLGRDILENVRDPIDNRLDQPDKDLGRAPSRLPLIGVERGQRFIAHRHQQLGRQHEADRGRPGIFGARPVHQRRAQA